MLFRKKTLPDASEEGVPRYLQQKLSLCRRKTDPESNKISAIVQPEFFPFLHFFFQILLEIKSKRTFEVPLQKLSPVRQRHGHKYMCYHLNPRLQQNAIIYNEPTPGFVEFA
jgi:hypothetical protein